MSKVAQSSPTAKKALPSMPQLPANLPPKDATGRPFRMRGPTYNLILEMAVGHPLLTPEQVAALVGREVVTVRALMRSDEFLERKAYLMLERYGDKIANVRHKILDVADAILDAITHRIADPEGTGSESVLLEAAKFIIPFVTAPVADPNVKTPINAPTLNVFVDANEAQRAREVQALNARTITVPPHPSQTKPSLRQLAGPKEGADV